jgi:hypothetical protein
MDEATKKRIDERAQEILDNPREFGRHAMRKLAERIAYHEIKLEDERAAEDARLASE